MKPAWLALSCGNFLQKLAAMLDPLTNADPVVFLRNQTNSRHRLLEAQGRFGKIMQPDITLSDYQSLLALLYRFYAGVEPNLCSALVSQPFRQIYRPRRELIATDLKILGCALPTPCHLRLPIDSPAQILGIIYVIEGSALGGQIICRHLEKTLGEQLKNALGFYTKIGAVAGEHWKNVRTLLQQELNDPAKLNLAAQSANCTFAALLELASDTEQKSPACEPA